VIGGMSQVEARIVVMLCLLALMLQLEIVSRTTAEVGAEIAGKNGEFSAGRRNAREKTKGC
jgi:hypothetical protein